MYLQKLAEAISLRNSKLIYVALFKRAERGAQRAAGDTKAATQCTANQIVTVQAEGLGLRVSGPGQRCPKMLSRWCGTKGACYGDRWAGCMES